MAAKVTFEDDVTKESVYCKSVHSVGHKKCVMLFRAYVSRKAAGKGRAILEGVGLLPEVIEMCYVDNPQQEEEAVQSGLLTWRNGGGDEPTWAVLLEAMKYAEIGVQHVKSLEEELLKVEEAGGMTSSAGGVKENCLYDSPLAQEYLERVRDTYKRMSSIGVHPHVDYIGLRVIESHPNQYKNKDTAHFLKNFQKATVDFISQQDGDMSRLEFKSDSHDEGQVTSGLLSHSHFFQRHKKPLHIVFGPPGVGKTSLTRHICSQFSSDPLASSHSLILLFCVREKKVAEARSLRDLLSCYSLPGDDSGYDELAQLIAKSKGRGLQIIFDGLDERSELLVDKASIVTKLLKGELKEAQIMVTSRPGIVTQLSDLWHSAILYEVQGFGTPEVVQYTETFFDREDEDPSAATKFCSALANRPDLAGSTYIPLNLWLLCSVFSWKNYNLPDTLTQCYTTLLVQLLQRQAEKEGLDISIQHNLEGLPDSLQSTLDCLSKLSYLCFLKEELVFDEEIVIKTCLSSCAKLKHRFDGMSLLNVHPKQHGALDHLTYNFVHSTYQEYLCAKHITAMNEEEQTAFWEKNIDNPRFAMVFRFYCGLSQLQVSGVQELVKGQELPSICKDYDRRLLFLFYALHESGNTQLTAAIASQLDSSLEFNLRMSSYDFYVTGQCLSKTTHLREMNYGLERYIQTTKYAIPCIASVASANPLVSVKLELSELTLPDAQKLTSALCALDELRLTLDVSSLDAAEEVLFIPTLKQLTLCVRSFSDCQSSFFPNSKSSVRKLVLRFPSDGAACLDRMINSCSQIEELFVECVSKDAGDIIASYLPNCKNLRKVTVKDMNPVPMLLSVGSCGQLDEVVIKDPKHYKVPADDGNEGSRDVSTAHLRQLKLECILGGADSEVLRTCLSIVSRYSSLEDLEVWYDTPDAGDIIASYLPKCTNLRKVTVGYMNPVLMLLSVGSCGQLDEVVISHPKHYKPTTEDWSKVSSSLATAPCLKKVELFLFDDVTFLEACLSSLSYSPSLQELRVYCRSSSAGQVLADNVLSLRSVEKLSICDINPVPLLHVLSQNAEHCSVSTLRIALEYNSEQLIGVSNLLGQCKSIRAFELYLNKGPESLNALNSCMEGVCHSSSIETLSISCLDPAAGPTVAQLLPNVVGRLVKLSVSLPDPTEVLEVLQDSSVANLTLDTTHLRYMTQHDQLRLSALLSGVKCGQVSVVFRHEDQFPYAPWMYTNISTGLSETLCVCTGLSENPHIRGAVVTGIPPGLLSEVDCLLMKNLSCLAITVNGETLRQVEPSDEHSSDEESFVTCTSEDGLHQEQELDLFQSCDEGDNTS